MNTAQVFEGVKVLEFTTALVGPNTGRFFSDYGATVVHVESVVHPDVVRLSPPYKEGVPRINASAYWSQFNSGKYSVSLDLKTAEGKGLAKRLVSWSDALIENFAPGVMERLGLGYDNLVEINPALVMISISNLGRTGPYARQPGLGQSLQALSGLAHLTGWPERSPDNPFGAIPDHLTAHLATAVLIAALDYKQRTGKGQFIDLSQFEVSCSMLAPLLLDFFINGREAMRAGNHDADAAPHGVYPCLGHDRWCAIAVFTEEEWVHFCGAIDRSNLISADRFNSLHARKMNEDELDLIIAQWTKERTAEEAMHKLQSAGVAAGIVNTPAGLFTDPQMKHRRHFNMVDHPEIGPHSIHGQPSQLSSTPAVIKAAPVLGEHNELVLKDILGLSDEEYLNLVVKDVLK